jgi:hypothetical protein
MRDSGVPGAFLISFGFDAVTDPPPLDGWRVKNGASVAGCAI